MNLYLNFKKNYFFFSLFAFLCLSFFAKENNEVLAKGIKLQKSSINLSLNEEKILKIIGKKKGDKITFTSKSPTICRVSKTGRLLGMSPGKTSILVTIKSEKGKIKKKLTAKIKVGTIILASTVKNLERALKNPSGTTILLKPKKETSFFIPKGNFHYSLQIDMGNSEKEFHLKTDQNSFLKEIQLKNVKKADFHLEGELSSLSNVASGSAVSITTLGKKAFLSQILIQANSKLSFHMGDKGKKENTTKIYLSNQTDLSITGKSHSTPEVYVWKDAMDSKIKSNRSIRYYSDVPSSLELGKGAESSILTTLNYRTPITVKNNTSSILQVNTPSLIKTIDIGEEKTISGKK